MGKKSAFALCVIVMCFLGGCLMAKGANEVSEEVKVSDDAVVDVGSITTAGGYEIPLSKLGHLGSDESLPIVYYTPSITAEALVKAYGSLGVEANGKVAVKIHTGESERSNNLDPMLIKNLVAKVDGTLVECNTAYGGSRASTALHKQVAKDRGYTAIAPVDIQDEDGSFEIPAKDGKRLSHALLGASFPDYDFYIILSHFKGHAMGGFGGAMKNVAIGMSSQKGKILVHNGGTNSERLNWATPGDNFLEAMAEDVKAVSEYLDGGKRVIYISVMNNVSVDCDCDGNPKEPDMHDVGVFASTDPVACDQACVDFLYAVPDGASVIERMKSRNGEHTLEYAEEIGVGSREYRLEEIDV